MWNLNVEFECGMPVFYVLQCMSKNWNARFWFNVF